MVRNPSAPGVSNLSVQHLKVNWLPFVVGTRSSTVSNSVFIRQKYVNNRWLQITQPRPSKKEKGVMLNCKHRFKE